MANAPYPINRHINRSIEFKGFKAQYILYAGGLVAGGIVFFALLYICGIHPWICTLVVGGTSGAGIWKIRALSMTYGEFGLLKKRLAKYVPPGIRCRSRKMFTHLNKRYEKDIK